MAHISLYAKSRPELNCVINFLSQKPRDFYFCINQSTNQVTQFWRVFFVYVLLLWREKFVAASFDSLKSSAFYSRVFSDIKIRQNIARH